MEFRFRGVSERGTWVGNTLSVLAEERKILLCYQVLKKQAHLGDGQWVHGGDTLCCALWGHPAMNKVLRKCWSRILLAQWKGTIKNLFTKFIKANCTNCWWLLTIGGYFSRNMVHGDPCPGNITKQKLWRSENTGRLRKETYWCSKDAEERRSCQENWTTAIFALVAAQSMMLINIYWVPTVYPGQVKASSLMLTISLWGRYCFCLESCLQSRNWCQKLRVTFKVIYP